MAFFYSSHGLLCGITPFLLVASRVRTLAFGVITHTALRARVANPSLGE